MPNPPKKEPEEDVLQIVLNESRDLRNQQLNQLFQNSENMWGTLNFLMLILGIYISAFLFLCDNGNLNTGLESIATCPLIFCIIFLLVAIIKCIKAVFPTYMFKVPDKNSIYGLIVKEKKKY